MRRAVSFLFLPIWLFIALASDAHAQPQAGAETAAAQTATKSQLPKGKAKKLEAGHKQAPIQKEAKIGKVEAAPLAIVQVQAPQADFCLPSLPSLYWPSLPQNQLVQPLRANGKALSGGFGHRFYSTAIALRAP